MTDLSPFQAHLEAAGFTCQFEPADQETPIDQLFVLLELDEPSEELALELAFVPDIEDELDHLDLLQVYVSLPIDLAERDLAEVAGIVADANLQLPLVGFGLHREERALHFRHVLPLPRDGAEANPVVVTETVWIAFYLIESFYPLFQAPSS